MRNKFDEQLEKLNVELIEMGAMCEEAISGVAKALKDNDVNIAREVIKKEKQIDHKEKDIESLCLKLLLQQQPVARDLRMISSALKMITDMERIGDQASDIAEIIKVADISSFEDTSHVGDMAAATIRMVTDSVEAYVKSDLDLARSVVEYDDVVDALFNKVKSEITSFIGHHKEEGEYAIDLLMIAKYFERIGDHATNIAEWVEFSLTGKYKGEDES
ncbi:phosphate uptake regulator, PhoU [Hathewaya proteolytica DSM 3090]|uniref:Phosphate-specific transport system accessory protein PhoU n=1 Tax=Hathewaya proteolytica DSM 3090 TaxID=1121331 RepID=A0A1M6PVH2_9CLOT|nr:phosphate signaling complex protein PhoU [Hathewaya proteolytica]SHK11918.1 phosphate uptake regulator, PhoU [Hathewaya proteolytica DSM 3090]